jgi:hypothetical protein
MMTTPYGNDRTFTVKCKVCAEILFRTARLDDLALRDLQCHLDDFHPGVRRIGFYAPDLPTLLREFDVIPEE